MLYNESDKILDFEILHKTTTDEDTILKFLNLADGICNKNIDHILENVPNIDFIYKKTHDLISLGSVGMTSICNISKDIVNLTRVKEYDEKLCYKYLKILLLEIGKFKQILKNLS